MNTGKLEIYMEKNHREELVSWKKQTNIIIILVFFMVLIPCTVLESI